MKGIVWIGIVWLVFLGASLFMGCGRDEGVGELEAKSTAATPVQVAQVVRGDISTWLSYTGSIKPWREVKVVPDIPGKVAKIYVREGDRVKQGQVLAELDTRTARLQFEQSEAGLVAAQANFHSASKDWERTQELRQRGTVSPQQYEKVQLAYEAAKAQLQQAESGLKLARHQLEISVMKAPFSGIVTERNMNEGEYINPAMSGPQGPSVLTLMDLSKVKIEVHASENDMGKISIGQEAHVTVDAYPERTFYGKVSSVHPAADPMSRTFKVEVAVPNEDRTLKAGMYTRMELYLLVHKGVLLVPERSVLERKGMFVLFVADGDMARMREVKLGLSSRGVVEIVEGVQEGEKVIVRGNYGLKDGVKVEW